MATVPRAEYPRPQFVREDWLNLNGEWEFEVDHGDSGQLYDIALTLVDGQGRVLDVATTYGGLWWNPDASDKTSWGYGDRPKSIEEFHARFEGLCNVLLDNPLMFGYCYTQLTDVFQECNGIFFFDQTP